MRIDTRFVEVTGQIQTVQNAVHTASRIFGIGGLHHCITGKQHIAIPRTKCEFLPVYRDRSLSGKVALYHANITDNRAVNSAGFHRFPAAVNDHWLILNAQLAFYFLHTHKNTSISNKLKILHNNSCLQIIPSFGIIELSYVLYSHYYNTIF